MTRVALLLPILVASTGLAGAPPRVTTCIDIDRVIGKTIENGDLIVRTIGGRDYRNRGMGRCPSLHNWRPGDPLVFVQQGAQLCRGDRLSVADTAVPGMPCILGRFEPIAEATAKE